MCICWTGAPSRFAPHPLSLPPSLPPSLPLQTWLMDGATYPIIVIITFAVTMCSSFTA